MSNDYFRVLVVDLESGKSTVEKVDGRNRVAGGSGLAALLYSMYGRPGHDWDDPLQPFILAIGPLTGHYPLMSKTVCSFISPYHNQYTESHGGGRSALALFFAGYDGLVIVGRAAELCCLSIGSRHVQIKDTGFMRGMNSEGSGKLIRRMFKKASGHRSIMRIGPAGEIGSAMACINVDSYRHFGRLGGGAVMGVKNLKGLVINGDGDLPRPPGKAYPEVFKKVYRQVTSTDMMKKYYHLGTAANLQGLNEIKSLPWRNLQQTTDPSVSEISGEVFAEKTLLRNGACSGCPVGCIHLGFFRDQFKKEARYLYHQVPYDYEPIFAAGSMLGVTDCFDILRILEDFELVCIDAMSAGVALGWATEATQRGLISEKQTLVRLSFGDAAAYQEAANYLGRGVNDFYRLLGMGTLKAAAEYGGEDFSCVLGQEMAGYATGELFFAAQSLGFRHSHLDTGAYSWDQKHAEKDVEAGVGFLMEDEPGRVFLTSMVACLFARSAYNDEQLGECLEAAGYENLAATMPGTAEYIRKLRWKVRVDSGFSPQDIVIPQRFYKVETWKGKIDGGYLDALKSEYGKRILALVEGFEP
ncbi:MAG: aldehyde ferredoxin oxidoreductase N-terminal domain-containing protein [Desulfocapsaceae bacterium]|nr:aldehyde ferredoxin oxidoreductase N-terminal domain-containing protein [Desulfocapsaceae bacterium]